MKRNLLLIGVAVFLLVLVILILNFKKISFYSPFKKETAGSAASLISQAQRLAASGDLLGAKNLYQRAIAEFSNSSEVMHWQKSIEEINIKLLFSSASTPNSIFYQVKAGDTLAKIAKEFKTTIDLIKKSNHLSTDRIVPGKKIKAWIAPFSIMVDKSQNTLILKTNEEVFKTYVVSTGANNSTPVGKFKIINKLINPTWFKAGAVVPPNSPENILGSRWLGFDLPEYGIHGTTDPESLGRQVTQGCVRMSNPDVEELYTIIPQGTEVTIID